MVRKKKKRGFYDQNNMIKLLETQPKDIHRSQKKNFWIGLFSKKTIKEWYTVEELASLIGFSNNTILRLTDEGLIRTHYLRNTRLKRYYHTELAEDFLKLDVQITEQILLTKKNKTSKYS